MSAKSVLHLLVNVCIIISWKGLCRLLAKVYPYCSIYLFILFTHTNTRPFPSFLQVLPCFCSIWTSLCLQKHSISWQFPQQITDHNNTKPSHFEKVTAMPVCNAIHPHNFLPLHWIVPVPSHLIKQFFFCLAGFSWLRSQQSASATLWQNPSFTVDVGVQMPS